MARPVVTALRARGVARGFDRVEIDLDGRPWRVVPAAALLGSGLAVGTEIDRERARSLGRELRRLEAQGVALRALDARDHTSASLERRLAARGIRPGARRQALESVQRAGLVDDERFAGNRAAALAGRGAGDLLIADDLGRQGVPGEVVQRVLESLAPEVERAAVLVAARGASARTARYLASRGFSEATLEPLVAELMPDGVG